MRLPTSKQLRYLCAVAQTKHFGRAAKQCFVSQSSLSAGIQDLEGTLNTVLFERSKKGVLLTSIGEEIVTRSYSILTEMADLVSLCEASREPLSTRMRIGVIPTIAPFILPRLLKQLRKEHPSFHLYIREDLSDRLVDSLQQGELDVLLLALPFPAENTKIQHLYYDDFLLAFPNKHEIRHKIPLRLKNLRGEELLLLEDGHCLRDHALSVCKLKESDINVPYQATSLNTIVQMVANNIGMTLLPRMALQANILLGTNVKTQAFEEKNIHRSIGLMWRKTCPREDEFQFLGEFIRKHLQ